MNNLTFKKAVENAAALKSLGQHDVYLRDEIGDDYPWHLASDFEPGGSHRLDIATSGWFSCNHESGLRFRWSFDIEPYSANGTGSYQIDAAACRSVMRKLNEPMRAEFRKYLLECAQKVAAKGVEWQAVADRQMSDAAQLRDIAAFQP